MPVTVTATEARVHFGDLLRRVNDVGEPVFVERDGKVRAVVVSPEVWARATATDRRREALERLVSLGDRLSQRGAVVPDAADMIRQDREERDAAIADLR